MDVLIISFVYFGCKLHDLTSVLLDCAEAWSVFNFTKVGPLDWLKDNADIASLILPGPALKRVLDADTVAEGDEVAADIVDLWSSSDLGRMLMSGAQLALVTKRIDKTVETSVTSLMSGAITPEQHSKLVQKAAAEFEDMPGLDEIRKREFAMAVALRESAASSGDLKLLCGEALFASVPKNVIISGGIAKKLLSKAEKAREHLEGLVKLQPAEDRTGDKLEVAMENFEPSPSTEWLTYRHQLNRDIFMNRKATIQNRSNT
eukprot:6492773-Amphidinium_carterae.4